MSEDDVFSALAQMQMTACPEWIVADTELTVQAWLAGMKRMCRYTASRDARDVVEGFEVVEQCLIRMDQIQDRALARA